VKKQRLHIFRIVICGVSLIFAGLLEYHTQNIVDHNALMFRDTSRSRFVSTEKALLLWRDDAGLDELVASVNEIADLDSSIEERRLQSIYNHKIHYRNAISIENIVKGLPRSDFFLREYGSCAPKKQSENSLAVCTRCLGFNFPRF